MTENRDEIVRLIVEALSPLGAERIALFGSFARKEPGAHDIDILVKFPSSRKRKRIGLKWFTLDQELSVKLGMPVDLVSEDSVSPRLRAQIEKDLEVIYEKAG